MSYSLTYTVVNGFKHSEKGLSCEDSVLVREDRFKIFSVADGHSDINSPRAEIGSRLAVECSVLQLSRFCEMQNGWDSFDESTVNQLILSIFTEWKEKCYHHLDLNPFSREELVVPNGMDYERNIGIERAYGTTLISCVIDEQAEKALIIQVGDGSAVVFDKNGVPCRPVPDDPACEASYTSSLCHSPQVARYAVLSLEDTAAIVITTDGIGPGGESTDVYIGSELIGLSERALSEELELRSRDDTWDDIAVCIAYDNAYSEQIKRYCDTAARRIELKREYSRLRTTEYSILNGGKYAKIKKEISRLGAMENNRASLKKIVVNKVKEMNDEPLSVSAAKRILFKLYKEAFHSYRERKQKTAA